MKIRKKYKRLLFSLLMGFGMSFFMSFVMTLINIGFPPVFFQLWIKSWVIGFFSSLPAAIFLPTFIYKLLDQIIEK